MNIEEKSETRKETWQKCKRQNGDQAMKNLKEKKKEKEKWNMKE